MDLLNIRDHVADSLMLNGFAVASQQDFLLRASDRANLNSLSKFWDDLVTDQYLPAQFGSRSRRHGRFRFDRERFALEALPNEGYFQNYESNAVSGGKKRNFEPLQPEAVSNEFLQSLIKSNAYMLEPSGQRYWDIHAHFIRIPSTKRQQGVPCPEGVHSDGFHFISIHLMSAHQISGAHSTLYDTNEAIVGEATLRTTLDSIYADDRRIRHYTSPFEPTGGGFGHRDTLLLSYDPV